MIRTKDDTRVKPIPSNEKSLTIQTMFDEQSPYYSHDYRETVRFLMKCDKIFRFESKNAPLYFLDVTAQMGLNVNMIFEKYGWNPDYEFNMNWMNMWREGFLLTFHVKRLED